MCIIICVCVFVTGTWYCVCVYVRTLLYFDAANNLTISFLNFLYNYIN